MRAGKRRHRVVLDAPTTTRDAIGGEVAGWTPLGNFWASIEPLTGRETLAAGQLSAQMDTRICLRWAPALDAMTTKWRLRHGGVTYDLISIAHIQFAQREIELMCHSGRNNG